MKRLCPIFALLLLTGSAPAQSRRVDATVETIRTVERCVVNISTDLLVTDPFFERAFRRFPHLTPSNAPKRQVRSAGSGVLFHPDGYVLTNYHVVKNATRIAVFLYDGSEYPATVVACDANVDLAVLRITGDRPFDSIKLGDPDDVYIGETVIALGNPFGLSSSVSRGVLSAVERRLREGAIEIPHILQTDAAINPGNSGGPLVNLDAELIGINTAMHAGAENIAFAVPIKTVKTFLAGVVTHPLIAPAHAGFNVEGSPQGEALLIAHVEPESPAHKAGLAKGDVLKTLGGRPADDVAGFFVAYLNMPSTGEVAVEVLRDGAPVRKTLHLETLPATVVLKRKLGLVAGELDGRTGTVFDSTSVRGAIVVALVDESTIQAAPLRPGDAIIKVDGHPIKGTHDFAARLAGKKPGETVTLDYLRPGRSLGAQMVIQRGRVAVPVQE